MITALSTVAKGDVDKNVRASAIRAIGVVVGKVDVDQVDSDVVVRLREMAVSAAVQALQDPDVRVRKMGCTVLEESLTLFFEKEDIASYLDVILDALSNAGSLAVRAREQQTSSVSRP